MQQKTFQEVINRSVEVLNEFQKVEKLIPKSWDVQMDFIVTEKNIYLSSPRNKSDN